MNIQLPEQTAIIDIIKFAASIGCVVKRMADGNLKLEPKEKKHG